MRRGPDTPSLLAGSVCAGIALAALSGCGTSKQATPPSSGGGGTIGMGGAGGIGGSLPMTTNGSGGLAVAADCWGSGHTGWTVEPFDITALDGANARAPQVSGDGLTLYYGAGVGRITVWQTTRTSRDDVFVNGVNLFGIDDVDSIQDPWVVGVQGFARRDDNPERILISLFDGNGWSYPSVLGNGLGNNPTLDETASRLIGVDEETSGLLEAVRDAPLPSTSFGSASPLSIPPITDETMACPALAADGRRLFFSSVYPNGAESVFYTERATVDHDFQTAVEVVALDEPAGGTVCPGGVTADGCELWLTHRATPEAQSTFWVAKRDPTP